MKLTEEQQVSRFRTVLLSLSDISDGIRVSLERESDLTRAVDQLREVLEEVNHELMSYLPKGDVS